MSNGIRILDGMVTNHQLNGYECKDYPVWDGDRWNESWSSNQWGDSHGKD